MASEWQNHNLKTFMLFYTLTGWATQMTKNPQVSLLYTLAKPHLMDMSKVENGSTFFHRSRIQSHSRCFTLGNMAHGTHPRARNHNASTSKTLVWQTRSYLCANLVFHARTKYVEIDYHFILDKVASKELQVNYICTKDQLTCIFTKLLTYSKIQSTEG